MDDQEELKKMANTLDALEETEASLRRIMQYKEKLSAIPNNKLTAKQRLWLSAYDATEKDLPSAFENNDEAKEKFAGLLFSLDEESNEKKVTVQSKSSSIKKIIKNCLIFIALLIISTMLVGQIRGYYSDGFENLIIGIALASLIVYVWRKIARRYL